MKKQSILRLCTVSRITKAKLSVSLTKTRLAHIKLKKKFKFAIAVRFPQLKLDRFTTIQLLFNKVSFSLVNKDNVKSRLVTL